MFVDISEILIQYALEEMNLNIIITDKEQILASFNRELIYQKLDTKFENLLNSFEFYESITEEQFFSLNGFWFVKLINVHGDIIGFLILHSLNKIEEYNIPVWIRHVVVPGITNDKISLQTLAKYISQYKVIEKAEVLPYHTMGSYKYKELGIKYPLEDTPPLSIEELNIAKEIFRKNGIPCE